MIHEKYIGHHKISLQLQKYSRQLTARHRKDQLDNQGTQETSSSIWESQKVQSNPTQMTRSQTEGDDSAWMKFGEKEVQKEFQCFWVHQDDL